MIAFQSPTFETTLLRLVPVYTPTNRWWWALSKHKLSLIYTGDSQLGVNLLPLPFQGAMALTDTSFTVTGEAILVFLVSAGWDVARNHTVYRTGSHSRELPGPRG